MDKRKSVINISVSVGCKVILMVLSIVVKRMLIQTCGNAVNGLHALYMSIIGFLAVTELGVGTAITFCMYKPIVQQETEKVAALYQLFRRIYTYIGLLVLVCGLAITPFIHYFAKDYTKLDVNLYSSFVLVLLSTVLSYFFGAKTALINAYKNNYLTTAIQSSAVVLQHILQIFVLRLTRSFAMYLVCTIAATLVQWAATELVSRRKYGHLLVIRQKVDAATRTEVKKHIKAMFVHKIGGLLVFTFDGIIISAFVGVVALGEYSNYNTILSSMVGIIGLIFSSLTSVWGHVYAKEEKCVTQRYCELFHYVNFAVGMVFFLGYYAIIDNLVALLFAEDLVMSGYIPAIITVNGFVQFMRRNILVFRDTTGTFYYDQWKPPVEGLLNIVLSVLLVKWIGVAGVILGTLVTNLTICHIVEPYVLYKHAFQASVKQYYVKNYGMILIFCIVLAVFSRMMWKGGGLLPQLLVNGTVSVCISGAVCVAVLLLQPGIRRDLWELLRRE